MAQHYILTVHINQINCMKNSLNFSKTVWCDEIKESNFVYAIIHHHVIQWLLPFTLTAFCQIEESIYPNGTLIALIKTILKICIFQRFLFQNNVYMFQ